MGAPPPKKKKISLIPTKHPNRSEAQKTTVEAASPAAHRENIPNTPGKRQYNTTLPRLSHANVIAHNTTTDKKRIYDFPSLEGAECGRKILILNFPLISHLLCIYNNIPIIFLLIHQRDEKDETRAGWPTTFTPQLYSNNCTMYPYRKVHPPKSGQPSIQTQHHKRNPRQLGETPRAESTFRPRFARERKRKIILFFERLQTWKRENVRGIRTNMEIIESKSV